MSIAVAEFDEPSRTIVRRKYMRRGAIVGQCCWEKPYPINIVTALPSLDAATGTSSSPFSGSLSPGDDSTTPTSIESLEKVLAVAVPTTIDTTSSSLPSVQNISEEKDEEEPIPSIRTVEATASAKTFLESRYNFVYREINEREARCQELQTRLASVNAPEQLQQELHRQLSLLESNYLRSARVAQTCELRSMTGGRSTFPYVFLKTLGKGSFGIVRLAAQLPPSRDEAHHPKHVFAIKTIRKSDMLRSTQEAHIRAERDILVTAEGSRWIVPLLESFQDRTNLYLVMEFMVGGDFLGLLIRWDKLEEPITRFYIGEMILCLEEAHRLGYIHRDVKPDNFLISASGHLKISDFGLAFDGHWTHDQEYYNHQRHSLLRRLGITVAGDEIDREEARRSNARPMTPFPSIEKRRKVAVSPTESSPPPSPDIFHETILDRRNRKGIRCLAHSVVGTSQYMAPEVIKGEDYDGRCDWWSIGVILFEVRHHHIF